MKRQLLCIVLALLIIVAIPLTAYAATPRMLVIHPILQFSDSTATCTVYICAEATDTIVAKITLYRGSTLIDSWTTSSVGNISFKDTTDVSIKGEYTLSVDVTINGVAQDQVSVTKTYE